MWRSRSFLPQDLALRVPGSLRVQPKSPQDGVTFQDALRAFVQQARLLARIDHPSLVNVLRLWEANGTAYRVMSYHEGHTLAHTRQSLGRPPNEAWLRTTLVSLLGALDQLHRAATLHGRVHPDNILVLSDGRVVLLAPQLPTTKAFQFQTAPWAPPELCGVHDRAGPRAVE